MLTPKLPVLRCHLFGETNRVAAGVTGLGEIDI